MPNIEHRTYIKVSPEKVYETLLSENEWNKWFTDQTSISINQDGSGCIHFIWKCPKNVIEDGGNIVEVITNKSFVFQWSPGQYETTVNFKMEPYKEGTLLILEEHGYTAKDIKSCISCAVGWGEAMTLLKVYLEHGLILKQDLLFSN